MAYAVTHVILAIVVIDLIRHYFFKKKKFPRYLVLIGGIAGLAPDLDIVFSWIYNFFMGTNVSFHGGLTHSILIPVLLLGIGYFLQTSKNIKWSKILYVISFGWFFHLILDCVFGGYKYYLWPLPAINFCPQFAFSHYMIEIDAIILILWLLHEELHHKIKDYF
ncbi:metal-dependent hydrolase [Nanoarchaeota archaeon]